MDKESDQFYYKFDESYNQDFRMQEMKQVLKEFLLSLDIDQKNKYYNLPREINYLFTLFIYYKASKITDNDLKIVNFLLDYRNYNNEVVKAISGLGLLACDNIEFIEKLTFNNNLPDNYIDHGNILLIINAIYKKAINLQFDKYEFLNDIDENKALILFKDQVLKVYKIDFSIKDLENNLDTKPINDKPEIEHSPTDAIKNSKKINWLGDNQLEILALFELLEKAGLIQENSFKYADRIIRNTFLNKNKQIKENYFNKKKNDGYPEMRMKLINRIGNKINDAFLDLIEGD